MLNSPDILIWKLHDVRRFWSFWVLWGKISRFLSKIRENVEPTKFFGFASHHAIFLKFLFDFVHLQLVWKIILLSNVLNQIPNVLDNSNPPKIWIYSQKCDFLGVFQHFFLSSFLKFSTFSGFLPYIGKAWYFRIISVTVRLFREAKSFKKWLNKPKNNEKCQKYVFF